jgi:hypothetical protein
MRVFVLDNVDEFIIDNNCLFKILSQHLKTVKRATFAFFLILWSKQSLVQFLKLV